MVLVDVYHVNVEVVVIQYNSALASRPVEWSSITSPSLLEKRMILVFLICSPMQALFVHVVLLNKIWVIRKRPTFFPARYISTCGTICGDLVCVAPGVVAVAGVGHGHVAEGGALAGWGRGRDVEEARVAFCCGRTPGWRSKGVHISFVDLQGCWFSLEEIISRIWLWRHLSHPSRLEICQKN